MIQIVMAGYHIKHIKLLIQPSPSPLPFPVVSWAQPGQDETVEDKMIPKLKPRWLFQSACWAIHN